MSAIIRLCLITFMYANMQCVMASIDEEPVPTGAIAIAEEYELSGLVDMNSIGR